MSVPQITLFDAGPSSYCMKVRAALREKGLPFTSVNPLFAAPGTSSIDFTTVNPRFEVPALMHAGASIFDSTVILEYLEEAFPQSTRLYPPITDPAARAQARIVEDVADTTYEAINWGWGECLWQGRAGEEGSALYEHFKTEAQRQTREVQAWLEEKLGDHDYFGGQYGFGVADISVWPVVNRSEYYGYGPKEGSKLRKWLERVSEREAIRDTKKEFMDTVSMMTSSREAFRSGKRQREYRDHRLEFLVRCGGMGIVEQGVKENSIRFSWPYGKPPSSSL